MLILGLSYLPMFSGFETADYLQLWNGIRGFSFITDLHSVCL